MSIRSTNFGIPRFSQHKQLQNALESFWSKEISSEELYVVAREIRKTNWLIQKENDFDIILSNDFTFHDHVLDMAVTLGVIPKRFRHLKPPIDQYFAMARGGRDRDSETDIPALDISQWFGTDYYYTVPELSDDQRFKINSTKLLGAYKEAKVLGIETRPVILGPFSFLLLSKMSNPSSVRSPLDFISDLVRVYLLLFKKLKNHRVPWVQIDEPCLVWDLDERNRKIFEETYRRIHFYHARPKFCLTMFSRDLALVNKLTR